jgi:hypothetical protein
LRRARTTRRLVDHHRACPAIAQPASSVNRDPPSTAPIRMQGSRPRRSGVASFSASFASCVWPQYAVQRVTTAPPRPCVRCWSRQRHKWLTSASTACHSRPSPSLDNSARRSEIRIAIGIAATSVVISSDDPSGPYRSANHEDKTFHEPHKVEEARRQPCGIDVVWEGPTLARVARAVSRRPGTNHGLSRSSPLHPRESRARRSGWRASPVRPPRVSGRTVRSRA